MRSRHPSALELAAFFDGEDAPGVFPHAAGCARCRAALGDLQRVRAAVRGETVPFGALDDGVLAPAASRRRPALLLVPVAAVLLIIFGSLALYSPSPSVTRVADGGDVPPAPPLSSATGPDALAAAAETERVRRAVEPTSATSATSGTSRGPAGTAAVAGAKPSPPASAIRAPAPAAPAPAKSNTANSASGAPAAAAAPQSGPLRLGVPIPTQGPLAREGEEVLRAVRTVADAANRDGGVRGRSVEVVAVPVDGFHTISVPDVDVFVGGFGLRSPRPAGLDWILPAEPGQSDPGVAAGEVSPEDAGGFLADGLLARRLKGPVGVIVGSGPDAALADGLARKIPVERVTAEDGATCDQEMAGLRRQGVAAIAVAGPPELAQRCADAAARLAWRPAHGLYFAPSVAYAHLERQFSAQEARTVVGFPTPGTSEPGAQRFRRAVRGAESYRAMVSFAAAELTLSVVRQTGSVSAAAVSSGDWQSDLYHLTSGRNHTPRNVSARWGRWTTT